MKALVTGSEGFIGMHLCRILREDGHEVVGLDLKNGEDVNTCVLPYGIDRVFHLAAQTDARCADAGYDARENVLGSVRVMQYYRKRVTYASSSAVNYLTTPYAISKLAGEHYAKLFGCGIVRFCNVYGDGGRSFLDKFRTEKVVQANLPGEQIRTYAHVEEACHALLVCKPGQFNILKGFDLTVRQICDEIYRDKIINWRDPDALDVIEGRQVYGL